MTDQTAASVRQRCLALLRVHRHAEAAAMAREGLASSPGDAGLLDVLATALVDGDRPADGLPVARELLAAQPDSWRGHELVGWGLHRAGRHREAIPHLERAVAMAPTDATIRVMLVEAIVRNAGGGRSAGAMVGGADPHVAEALRLAPDQPGPYLVAAKVAIARRDLATARRWSEEGLRRDPGNPVGHQLMAIISKSQGDVRRAGDHYLAAARSDPRSTTGLAGLRRLRLGAPISAVVVFIAVRLLAILGESTGAAVFGVLAVAIVVACVLYAVVGSRWLARRQLSDEAREVLARDRSARRRR